MVEPSYETFLLKVSFVVLALGRLISSVGFALWLRTTTTATTAASPVTKVRATHESLALLPHPRFAHKSLDRFASGRRALVANKLSRAQRAPQLLALAIELLLGELSFYLARERRLKDVSSKLFRPTVHVGF